METARPESQPDRLATAPAVEETRKVDERPADFFAWKDDNVVAPKKSVSSLAPSTTARESSQPAIAAGTTQFVHPDTDHADVYAWRDEAIPSKKPSVSSFTRRDSIRPSSPPARARSLSPRGSMSSMASSYGQVMISAPGKHVSVSVDPTDVEQRRGRSSSVRISIEDPFVDPFADPPNPDRMPKPHNTLSPIYSVNMPEPEPAEPEQERPPMASEPDPFFQGFTTAPVASMPVAITESAAQTELSGYTIGEGPSSSTQQLQHDTDERIPLLQNPAPLARGGNGKVNAYPNASSSSAIAFPSVSNLSKKPSGPQSFETLGWKEYTLPDSSVYFAHASMRISTDVDLRSARRLAAVTDYIERKLPEEVAMPPAGWELWLRDAGTMRHDFKLVRNWVNHGARILSSDPPPTISGEVDTLTNRITDDDRLDMEYRYWSFLEAHPAHTPLVESTKAEAMEALTWSYTDCLLPSSRPVPPPFAPQECQELMGLLRSFDSEPSNTSVVQTRIVARVLLRVVQWRQYYFRPNKPLPRDAAKSGHHPERRMPFRRAILDFVIGVLCLGIPYLFLGRTNHQRIDEESGLRTAGPMLIVGACACLVAAVILSASVTFISLPGIDDVARLSGMVAIILSASSMISAVIALFRYKSDIERSMVYVSGEGLMMHSRRSIVMSMPLVFLAWAIAAFMTGITWYSFRGATITSKVAVRYPFREYTHWAVVGTLGGMAGFLFILLLLARR
ncbi:hypothetical protein OBBRIDRAFT_793697 [Obba rivulosa]|uniref:Uncharacterized protein n=1 Tax=Obba rivulosa TaxID=1052685 RepID=A0A8E2DKE8_9APHY|nr:hypothetical protein OBBRIDRAFT_793697 [Obba rivulosa]